VVTFDSRTAGTPAEEWQRSRWLRDAPPLNPGGVTRAVIVAAHPDDETLGAGALIADLADRGVEVTVVIVTDGAASHPDSTTHTSQMVGLVRVREATEAIRALAAAAVVVFLDVADGGTADSIHLIRSGIAERLGGAELMVAPWRGDGHRDHRVVGEVCAELAAERSIRLLEYPIWMWHWGSPSSDELAAIGWVAHPVDPRALEAKRIAIAAYTSQMSGFGVDAGDGPVLDDDFLANFRQPAELFVETAIRATCDFGEPYFDDLYRRRDDPWRLESRWYERRKRAVTMSALPAERYRSALEIGSSIGMLTVELAGRCDRLLSIDVAESAVEQARARLAGRDSVRIEHRDAVTDFPDGEFDLIVISEVGYYWTRNVLESVVRRASAALTQDGALVLCHWRHPVDDYLLSGDEVHSIARGCIDLELITAHEEEDFRLDVLSTDRRSVAQREGFAS